MKKTKKYRVNDIFFSIQGEGVHTGETAIFVRFSGCNLSCPWCDTDSSSYTLMTAQEIAEKSNSFVGGGIGFIILTGGEPALQVDEELIKALKEKDFYICIETNGTLPLPEGIDWITCSPKVGAKLALKKANELKIVYTGQDVEEIYDQVEAAHYLLQPCSMQNTKETVDFIMKHPWWRLSLQIQKYLDIK